MRAWPHPPTHPPRLIAQHLVVGANINHAGQHASWVEPSGCSAGREEAGGKAFMARAPSALAARHQAHAAQQ